MPVLKRYAAAAAVALSLLTGSTREEPTVGWFTYEDGPQTCRLTGTVAAMAARMRQTYGEDPISDDTKTDETGTVVAVKIFVLKKTPFGVSAYRVFMFRTKADCDAYAAIQRGDPR
jgi:hypothetical protein